MVTMKITNDDPIGLYIQPVFMTNSTLDKKVQALQGQTNQAISYYSKAAANKENCQRLQNYLKEYQARLVCCRDSEAKFELTNQLTNIIDNLQTGIDRESHTNGFTSNHNKPVDKYGGWLSYSEQYQKCLEQYKVSGYQHLPRSYNPNTVEGYIRLIRNVADMDVWEFVKKHGEKMIQKFYPITKADRKLSDEQFGRRFDSNMASIIKKFTFVKLTTGSKQNVIIDLSDTDDDED